jgi:hypothetical protein
MNSEGKQPWTWIGEDGGHRVGFKVSARTQLCQGVLEVKQSFACGDGEWRNFVLVHVPATGEHEWVEASRLNPYPAEPIPEPVVKGGEA